MTATAPIFAEIEALLERGSSPGLAELEDTLTSGYAAALALEAERWRLERQIADLAGAGAAHADELSRLARRVSATDEDLTRLRALLVTVRDRTQAARAA